MWGGIVGWVTANQATPTTMQRVLRVPIGRVLALRLSRGYASIQLGKSTDGALSMPLHVTLVTYVPFSLAVSFIWAGGTAARVSERSSRLRCA